MVLHGEEQLFHSVTVSVDENGMGKMAKMLDDNDAGWVLRALMRGQFGRDFIGKHATVAEGVVDTMGLTLKKYSMHHPVMHIRELSKDVIAKLKKDLKELKAAAKAASEPENKDRKKRQLAQLEEERAALEAKIQKLEDPEATDDEPEILEQPLEQPPAAHEDEPAILEQGKPGDTKACPNCTYVCSQAFMCCPMCRHDFFFMDEDDVF